jgi:hypothetical protein
MSIELLTVWKHFTLPPSHLTIVAEKGSNEGRRPNVGGLIVTSARLLHPRSKIWQGLNCLDRSLAGRKVIMNPIVDRGGRAYVWVELWEFLLYDWSRNSRRSVALFGREIRSVARTLKPPGISEYTKVAWKLACATKRWRATERPMRYV